MPLVRNLNLSPSLSSSASSTTVAASTTSGTILAANGNRKGASIASTSTGVLSLAMGATATASSFVVQLNQGDVYEVPFGYTGAISGIFSNTNGNALVWEFV